jgi:hypothetical protein
MKLTFQLHPCQAEIIATFQRRFDILKSVPRSNFTCAVGIHLWIQTETFSTYIMHTVLYCAFGWESIHRNLTLRSWENSHTDRYFCDSKCDTSVFYNSTNFVEHSFSQKLIVAHLVKQYPLFYGTWRCIVAPLKKRKCISVFTRVSQWVLS